MSAVIHAGNLLASEQVPDSDKSRDAELDELIRAGWGDVPQNQIPPNWRELEPPKLDREGNALDAKSTSYAVREQRRIYRVNRILKHEPERLVAFYERAKQAERELFRQTHGTSLEEYEAADRAIAKTLAARNSRKGVNTVSDEGRRRISKANTQRWAELREEWTNENHVQPN